MTSSCFLAKPLGFRVQHLYRYPVMVELEPWVFMVKGERQAPKRCGLCNGSLLSLLVARGLLGLAESTGTGDTPQPDRRGGHVARAIAADVCAHRMRLLARVEPAVHGVQRRVLRIAGRVPLIAEHPVLYREHYIVKDILNYHAAAIALAYLEEVLWPQLLRARCHAQTTRSQEDGTQGLGADSSGVSLEELVAAMSDWRGLFSPDGRPYRSLNRTLMNLPRDVPSDLVCYLNQILLERPVVNPLEITALLLAVGTRIAGNPETRANRLRIFQHATAAEIARALARIAIATNRELHPHRVADVRFAVQFLSDYPEGCPRSLGALVEQTIRWHRDAHERQAREELVARLGGSDVATARPPIPLPIVSNITFLSTVGEVVEEGVRMKHCIATRAPEAVDGRCFLFHVDYRGEQASVELSAEGEVTDAEGPCNTDNLAVQWGSMQLRAWGRGLRAPQAMPRRLLGRRPRRVVAADPNQLTLAF